MKAKLPGRDVRRVEGGDRTYFVKRVRGRGAPELLNEAAILNRLRRLGLPVAQPVAVGAEDELAAMITVGLPVATSLESVLLEDASPARRSALAVRVGEILRDLHAAGVNHRDFYAGHILLGHFEDFKPKWRRILKVFVGVALFVVALSTLGRFWAWVIFVVPVAVGGVIVHGWWLPKHGIHGWTGEPREKYLELVARKRPSA